MISALASLYRLKFTTAIVYMLQSTEYQPMPYLRWFWRTRNFNTVMHRRELVYTRPAILLLMIMRFGIALQIVIGIWLVSANLDHPGEGWPQLGLAVIISAPIVWAHLIIIPLPLARSLIVRPVHARQIRKSRSVFANHRATIIAVAGSYGKTTMKELLLTVLGDSMKVAATPANSNVAISHARFAAKLQGDEDILIIEYGEGAPKDVVRFSRNTRPTVGIITGLAPAHLDKYKTLDRAAKDIFSLADYLNGKQVYVNGESDPLKPYIKKSYHAYDRDGVLGWKVSDVEVTLQGTKFTMTKDKQKLKLESGLIGRHQIGPLALVAAIAHAHKIPNEKIREAIAKTTPFEHRMEPRNVNGAWIIDDTYNGNIEGMKAGLELLKELPSSRKLYITPGLVDQGKENKRVHIELGEAIANANPEFVILMQNSTTEYIMEGLKKAEFEGEVSVENNPLDYYSNIDQFVASGDIVLMQNDWTDNYA